MRVVIEIPDNWEEELNQSKITFADVVDIDTIRNGVVLPKADPVKDFVDYAKEQGVEVTIVANYKDPDSFQKIFGTHFCDDCVSRKAVLDELEEDQYHLEYCREHGIDRSVSMEMVRIRLHDLPVVYPKQRTGHWIVNGEMLKCSECGELSCCKGRFCPDCGCKMRD